MVCCFIWQEHTKRSSNLHLWLLHDLGILCNGFLSIGIVRPLLSSNTVILLCVVSCLLPVHAIPVVRSCSGPMVLVFGPSNGVQHYRLGSTGSCEGGHVY